jgi:hypothetical protein
MTHDFIILTRDREDGPDIRIMVGQIVAWMPDDDGPGSYVFMVGDPTPTGVCESPRQIDELIIRGARQ